MRLAAIVLSSIAFSSSLMLSQSSNNPGVILSGTVPTGSCSGNPAGRLVAGVIYTCLAEVWSILPGGSTSVVPFGNVSGGTNVATLTVGTDGLLTFSGTGVVNANNINGGAIPASAGCAGTNSSSQIVSACIFGTSTVSVGTISDGVASVVGTITVTGASLGDPVTVGSQSALPTGVYQFGKVTSTNTVTVEIYNISGIPQTPGSVVLNATIIH